MEVAREEHERVVAEKKDVLLRYGTAVLRAQGWGAEWANEAAKIRRAKAVGARCSELEKLIARCERRLRAQQLRIRRERALKAHIQEVRRQVKLATSRSKKAQEMERLDCTRRTLRGSVGAMQVEIRSLLGAERSVEHQAAEVSAVKREKDALRAEIQALQSDVADVATLVEAKREQVRKLEAFAGRCCEPLAVDDDVAQLALRRRQVKFESGVGPDAQWRKDLAGPVVRLRRVLDDAMRAYYCVKECIRCSGCDRDGGSARASLVSEASGKIGCAMCMRREATFEDASYDSLHSRLNMNASFEAAIDEVLRLLREDMHLVQRGTLADMKAGLAIFAKLQGLSRVRPLRGMDVRFDGATETAHRVGVIWREKARRTKADVC